MDNKQLAIFQESLRLQKWNLESFIFIGRENVGFVIFPQWCLVKNGICQHLLQADFFLLKVLICLILST